MLAFVVAGSNGDLACGLAPHLARAFDADLGRTEAVTCGVEGDARAPEVRRLARGERGDVGVLGQAAAESGQAILDADVAAHAGAGVVGVGVGDQSERHGTPGVDPEAAGVAADASLVAVQQGRHV